MPLAGIVPLPASIYEEMAYGDLHLRAWNMARGWCWKKVALLLRSAGPEVLALTLTGLGGKKLAAAGIGGLARHQNRGGHEYPALVAYSQYYFACGHLRLSWTIL